MNTSSIDDNTVSLRPKIAISFLTAFSAFQVMRIFAFPAIQGVLDGTYAEGWLFLTVIDMVIAVAAPFIAFGLWRKTGLTVWTSAIVFFSIAIFEQLNALSVVYRTTQALPPAVPPDKALAMMVVIILTVLSLFAVKLLTSKKLREHYLRS